MERACENCKWILSPGCEDGWVYPDLGKSAIEGHCERWEAQASTPSGPPSEPGVYKHLEKGKWVWYDICLINERLVCKSFWGAYQWLDEMGEGQWSGPIKEPS